ncbi:hypothetical protein TCDM_08354 [Trypanosoma cruzi Dm28c]|uniref:EF-hand domain-containing protein n=2 Tax=Trypanosoma cruzi TaxID=5693 RepID=V5D8G2_TRYCR|nr:hypothetical protein TCDM_08354 [Trypanosoma cruzi Dm28c]PBJ76755.1 hypothetical protein BCY84_07912 [Trypanosoma cruzi cruzi]PWU97214.1 hypothetical protein C4B63_16g18 [Trypanosoma cruzi]
MQRESVVLQDLVSDERKLQLQPRNADTFSKPMRPLTEDEVLRLAQRYFISPAVAKEAYEVFGRYTAMEEQRRGRMNGSTMSYGRLTLTATKLPMMTLPEVTERCLSGNLEVPEEKDSTVAKEKEKKDGGENDGVTVWEPDTVSMKSTLCGEGKGQQQHQQKKEEEDKREGAQNNESEKESKEVMEETLGIEGLQQFFNDLGIRMSALEVSDMVHDLNDEPIDYVLRLRAMEAAAAESQAVAAGSPSAGQGQTRGPPLSNKAGSSRRRGNSKVDLSSGKETELSAPLVKDSSMEGVTFSQFLFILSHIRLEREESAEMKECEMRDLFHLLDTDGDGAITVRDIQTVVQRLIDEEVLADDRDIQQLSEMNTIELEAALMECDVDDDGYFTLEDMYGVLQP